MTRRLLLGALAVAALAAGVWFASEALKRAEVRVVEARVLPDSAWATRPPVEASGFLYGRVTTRDGAVYTGRLRWGGDEEAFWTDTFDGVKAENPWADHVPEAAQAGGRDRPQRPFRARLGDIARIEAAGGVRGALETGIAYEPGVRVVLKSGAEFLLDQLEAGDFDDGLRVWDEQHGVVDVGPRALLSVELQAPPPLRGAPRRLWGTVQTAQGPFTGPLQWNRSAAVETDELVGRGPEGARRIPFAEVRRIERTPSDSVRVVLAGGGSVTLGGTPATGDRFGGVGVDDPRFGRVLVSWEALEHVAFEEGASGPGYADFPAGHPLQGVVTTRDGRAVAGRIVFDLDESETTETLDAPFGGVDYAIPFGLVVQIDRPGLEGEPVRVALKNGEMRSLEPAGDLGPGNGGLLVFRDDVQQPDYVPWADVQSVVFSSGPSGEERTAGPDSAGP